jgi:hypothetical protein
MEQSTEASWRNMSYPEALGILNQVYQEVQAAPTVASLAKTFTLSPTQQKATLSFLYHVFNPIGELKTPDQGIWDMMSLLINRLNDAQITILFNDILFTAPSPAIYSFIAPGIRRRVKPRDCEAAILKQLDSSDQRIRQNALEFAYYVFGWDPDYWLSDEGRRILENAR